MYVFVLHSDKAVLWLRYLKVYVQEDLAQLEAVAGQTHQGRVSAGYTLISVHVMKRVLRVASLPGSSIAFCRILYSMW